MDSLEPSDTGNGAIDSVETPNWTEGPQEDSNSNCEQSIETAATITGPEDLDADSQLRHYSMLKQLQSMAKYAPIEIQQRLPNELLSNLAISLLDPTVIKIVSYLRIQQNSLMNELNLINNQKMGAIEAEKRKTMEKITKKFLSGTISSDKMASLIKVAESKHHLELKDVGLEICARLSEVVTEQQQIMESAKIPGFYVTDRPTDVKVMTQLLEFILKLDTKAI